MKFNEAIGNWDVSNVTNMEQMFIGAENFNQPLNDWNVSKVKNMKFMFMGAKAFNQPLDQWKIHQSCKRKNESVPTMTYMHGMFWVGSKRTFRQDLTTWDLDKTSLENLFLEDQPFIKYI